MSETAEARFEDLVDDAIKHYDEISLKAHHWSSTVVHALEFYKKHGKEEWENNKLLTKPPIRL